MESILLLFPFIFQFPPTKNFLADMIKERRKKYELEIKTKKMCKAGFVIKWKDGVVGFIIS